MNDALPKDARRRQAEELARLLATPEGLRAVRLLQASGTMAARQPERGPEPSPTSGGARPISIWQPTEVEGVPAWVRPEPLPLGDHYAAERILRAKVPGGPRRVAFFGESAAAGYLYAPHLTPARVLEAQLCDVDGAGAWEVVDLSRTNERLATLAETAERSLQLEPDLLVVFAGNNWNLLETPELSPYAPSVTARQRLAAELRREGVPGAAREARRELVTRARQALARIAEIAAGRPVVLVIPEVNLADWETRQPATWLPGDGAARWHRFYRRARAALTAGDWGAAEAAAWSMVELDGGLGPAPFRLLARALEGQGRVAEARDAAISEVDSVHYPLLAFLAAPQATTTARELLAEGARTHGFTAVDLRQIFARWTGSPLPGRRLFLDYCHLTSEGMRVGMAAVAAALLRLTSTRHAEVGWECLLAQLPDPQVTAEVEATARLGAVIHSAHRLLPVTSAAPILEHGCRGALEASAGVVSAMLDLISARAAPCPAVFTGAQARNHSSPYRLLLQHGWRWDGLDADVISAVTTALEAVGYETRGGPLREEIHRRLLCGWGLREAGAELALPATFHVEPLARFFPEVMEFWDLPGRATCRCPWPETELWLVADATRDVTLTLTARLPAVSGWEGERRGRVSVEVNGGKVGRGELQEGWVRRRWRVPRQRLRSGLNRVTLSWPPPPPAGEAALEAAIRRLEEGVEADLHPVFGEIFSLTAQPR